MERKDNIVDDTYKKLQVYRYKEQRIGNFKLNKTDFHKFNKVTNEISTLTIDDFNCNPELIDKYINRLKDIEKNYIN